MSPAKKAAPAEPETTSSSRRSPQIGRIARLLAVDPDEVQGLEAIGDDDLRTLHDLISAMLSANGQEPFARVASLSKVLPGQVAGKLAERFLPPELAARVAVLLEPAKARELVTKVSVDYLAQLALVLDPVRSRPVVQAIPVERVTQVARALFDRGEYAAMAEFAGTVTLDALFGALGVATARDLVEVVPLLVWNDNIDKVVADIPAGKIDEVLAEIVEHDLWDRAEYLLGHLRPDVIGTLAKSLFEREQYAEMARFVGIVSPEHLFAALDVATPHDLLEVVPLLKWNDNIDQVVSDIPADKIDEVLAEIVEHDLWDEAEALVGHLRPDVIGTLAKGLFEREQYAAMARFVGVVEPCHLFAALDVATARDLIEVVPLLEWNDNLDAVIADVPAQRIEQILDEVADAQLWEQGNYLFEHFRGDARKHVLARATDVSIDVFTTLQGAADEGKLGAAAVALLDEALKRRTAAR